MGTMNDGSTDKHISAGGSGQELAFGAGQAQLEQIIRQLEGDDVELEEALGLYEQGVRLIKSLQNQLAAAEQKVEVLMGEIKPESSDATDTTLS
ncbi:MAG: exodeoxyribonuclease VII small subunit [Coriobacteriales bacterium]|jgi:exodeoxyribonuclease VII small subunit|nr:exodeoxyribonuclease VII small subunit [Coriobacteriales bacterium]